jgi:cell division septal protein FtsQ
VRTFWLLGIVLLGAAVWGGWTLATLPALRLKSLAITGLDHVSRDEVLARAHLDSSSNVWLFDRTAIARRIEALPYVATARIHVRPLANVWIEIAERHPAACVRDRNAQEWTIDRDSRVLDDGCDPSLPLRYLLKGRLAARPGVFLHDAELATLQGDARALAEGGDRFREFSHDAFGELEGTMHDGIAVRFGADGDLERKQRLIGPILAQLGPRASDVRAVDLRAPATPVVVYRHGDAGSALTPTVK